MPDRMTHRPQKKMSATQLLLSRITVCLFAFFAMSSVFSNPVDGHVAAGEATITQTPGNTVIDQSSQRAVIDWRSFNIGASESTHFNQPTGGVALNRIDPTQGMSQIYGRLTATGQIILVNPAGIYFGPGAYVNVGGLIASTVGISVQNFMAGHYVFDQFAGQHGAVINAGLIHAADNGLIALVGANVSNDGMMEVQMGSVVLASGQAFTIDMQGNQLVNFTIDEAATGVANNQHGEALTAGVRNAGAVVADGGRIVIAAKTASQILDHAINMSGVAQAKSVAANGGEIVLSGERGTVHVTGSLIASGKGAGEKGGTIKILSDRIAVYNNAVIDVSGNLGGGVALLGGNAQGIGPLQTASYLFFGNHAKIYADAITRGDGGVVVLWSNLGTKFYGTISARGGALGGNGGWVETSGKEYLEAYGSVNASAANGNAGSWLLDPRNVSIQNLASSGGTFSGANPNVFTPTADDAIADRNTIEASLNAGTSVTITTGASGTQDGNISVIDTITKTAGGAATLTLTAAAGAGVLAINAAISSTVGALSVIMSGLRIDLGAGITTNGGSINFNSPTSLTAGVTLSTGAGNTTFANTLNGGQALAINSTGTTTFSGVVGGTTPLTSLTTDADGTTAFGTGGTAITTSGVAGQVYNDAVTVNATTTFTANNSGAITFGSTLDSFNATSRIVNVNTSGTTTFGGAVGATRVLSSLTTDAGGTTLINGGSVATTGTGGQVYNDAVILGADTTLTTTNDLVTFASTVDRDATLARALTISAGSGAVTMTGDMGAGVNGALGAVALNTTGTTTISGNVSAASLTTNASGTTVLGGSTITTSGDITFNDAVSLTTIGKTITSTAGAIAFASTLNGVFSLILSGNTTVTLGGVVGGTGALSSLEVTAPSGISMRSVTTTGAQTYHDAATLTANTILTTTDSAVTFDDAIDRDGAARNLTINAGSGDITLSGNVGAGVNGALGAVALNTTGTTTIGGTVDASTLATDAGGTTLLNGGAISTTGGAGQVYNDAVILGADTTLTTSADPVVFASTIDRDALAARSLTINTTTNDVITLTGNVGSGVNGALGAIALNTTGTTTISGTVAAASLTTSTGGSTVLNTSSITTSGDILFNNAVTLASAATKTLTSTGGFIHFASTVTGAFDLIVNAATTALFGSTVGGTALTSLDVTAASGINVNANVTTSGTQDYNNAVTLGANTIFTTTDNAITFDSTIDRDATAARDLTISTGSGAINLLGNIGAGVNGALDVVALNSTGATTIGGTLTAASLTTNVGGTTAINGGAITTGGAQTYNDAVSLGQDTTLTVTAASSDITMANAANDFDKVITFAASGAGTLRDISVININAAAETPIFLNSVRNLTLNFTNAGIDFGAITATGTLNATASGAMTQSGALAITGTTTLAAGASNNITLDNTSNNFSTIVVNSGNNVTLHDSGALILGAFNVSGNLNVTTGGAITQSGTGVVVAGTTTFDSGSSNITLGTLTNDFNSVGITSANNVTLRDANAIILNASTIGGTLSVTSSGAITQSGALSVGSTATFAAGASNDITLTNASNDFSTVAITTGNNVSLTDSNAINLGASTVSGDMIVSAGGAVSDSGNIVVSGNLNVTGVGGVVLNSGANQIGDLTVSNASSGAITINTDIPLTISGYTQTGTGATTFTTIGAFTVADGVNINTNNGTLAITALDLDLAGSSTLNSGSADTTITQQSSSTGNIVLGGVGGVNDLTISGSELERIFTTDLTLATTTNQSIVVDGITAANSANIAGTTTLSATAGTLGTVTFQTAPSSFRTLSATGDSGITVNAGAGITTTVGNLVLNGGATAGSTGLTLTDDLTSAGSMTLSSSAGGINLAAPISLTANGITLSSAVNGAFNLTLDSGSANTTFSSTVGATTPVGSGVGAAITINSTGTTTFNNTVATNSGITAEGRVTFGEAVTLGDGDTGSTFNSLVTLTDGGGFTFSGYDGLDFNGGLATSGGDMTILSNDSTMNLAAVSMNSNLTVVSHSAPINFNSSVNGIGFTLTLQDNTAASTGTVTFLQYPNVSNLVIFGPPANYLVIFPSVPVPVPAGIPSDINNVLGMMYNTNIASASPTINAASLVDVVDVANGNGNLFGLNGSDLLGDASANGASILNAAANAMSGAANQSITAKSLIETAIQIGMMNIIADGSKLSVPERVPSNQGGSENAILNPANTPITQQDRQHRGPEVEPLSLKVGKGGKLLYMTAQDKGKIAVS